MKYNPEMFMVRRTILVFVRVHGKKFNLVIFVSVHGKKYNLVMFVRDCGGRGILVAWLVMSC